MREKSPGRRSLVLHCYSTNWYNSICGVDRGDQLVGNYNLYTRSIKWRRQVFSYMIEVTALNVYIIQKDGRPPLESDKHDYLQFCCAVEEEFTWSFRSRAARVG